MRAFDLSPLLRSGVGFDRFDRLFDMALRFDEAGGGYPPYNIEKTGEDAYRITVAVAGFADSELAVESKDGQLVVSGRKAQEEGEKTYLHRGIATRAFERRFQLAEYVRAVAARTQDGLLHIDLVREVPEALKPRRIEIVSGPVIESEKAPKAKAKAVA